MIQKQISSAAFTARRKKEVREKITNICNQMNMNGFISHSKITLNEWFEQYIRLYKEGNIKPQSISVMRNGYDSNIKQYIGEKRLQETSEFDIKNVLIVMQKNQLAYNTISRVFGC